MKDSKVVEKARETGGIGMIIGEILCLFLLRSLPILLSPLSFSPLHGSVNRQSRKQAKRDAKRDAKDGIVCHDNRKDLGIPNSLLFQVGTY